MTSVLNVDTIADKAGTGPVALTKQHAAKAWAGALDGSAVAVDSFGFSSFVDNGTGDNTCNFTNAMANVGYAAVTSCEDTGSANRLAMPYAKATGLFKIESFIANTGADSGASQNASVLGDLA